MKRLIMVTAIVLLTGCDNFMHPPKNYGMISNPASTCEDQTIDSQTTFNAGSCEVPNRNDIFEITRLSGSLFIELNDVNGQPVAIEDVIYKRSTWYGDYSSEPYSEGYVDYRILKCDKVTPDPAVGLSAYSCKIPFEKDDSLNDVYYLESFKLVTEGCKTTNIFKAKWSDRDCSRYLSHLKEVSLPDGRTFPYLSPTK